MPSLYTTTFNNSPLGYHSFCFPCNVPFLYFFLTIVKPVESKCSEVPCTTPFLYLILYFFDLLLYHPFQAPLSSPFLNFFSSIFVPFKSNRRTQTVSILSSYTSISPSKQGSRAYSGFQHRYTPAPCSTCAARGSCASRPRRTGPLRSAPRTALLRPDST